MANSLATGWGPPRSVPDLLPLSCGAMRNVDPSVSGIMSPRVMIGTGLALIAALACGRPDQGPSAAAPARSVSEPSIHDQVRADHYTVINQVSQLPPDIRKALARELGASEAGVASPEQPFNAGCVVEPGLPRSRLLLAGVSPRFGIVHFETGGFAISQRVLVVRRSNAATAPEKISANVTATRWAEREGFLTAVRSGELFADRSRSGHPGT
jgi:hypothetical protein